MQVILEKHMKELKVGETKKIHCRCCKIKTNHELLYYKTNSEKHPEYLNFFISINQVFQCRGCNTICLSIAQGFDGNLDPVTGHLNVTEKIFPDPYRTREQIKNMSTIPDRIKVIYLETLKAINMKLLILASIGIGGIIEAICNDKNIRGRNLKERIANLVKIGLITEDGANLLQRAREKRNISVHEQNPMTGKQLQLCMDVVDSVILNIYILPEEFNSFDASTNHYH